MPQPLVIIGASGHGREALDVVEAINGAAATFDFLGFLDDAGGPFPAVESRGAEVLGPISMLADMDAAYLVGIADPAIRRDIDETVSAWGKAASTVVHPAATIGSRTKLGAGAIVWAGARISTNVSIGRQVHVNFNATISHDCTVGDYVTITPGVTISGSVTLGDMVHMGAGCSTIHGVAIGDRCRVGAGAVVVRDLPEGVTAVGVPARPQSR